MFHEFSLTELNSRVSKAKLLMRKEGFQGLVVTAAANHFYFSGYRKLADWATFTRTIFVLIPRDKDPVLFVQDFDGPDAVRRSNIKDVRTFPEIMGAPVDSLADLMVELDMHHGKIGFELGYEQRLDMAVKDYETLRYKLPKAVFSDASDLIWTLRMIKSPDEIAVLRIANDIASRSFDRLFLEISEGMTEKEVAQKFASIMTEEGAELPGFIIVISGEGNYDRISARPSSRRLTKGDFLWIDAGVNYKGYWTDFCRAGVVGKPTDLQNHLQEMVSSITLKACRAIRPEMSVGDLYEICAKEFLENGLPWSFECGRAGHGVGLQLTEPPTIGTVDSTILKPGMVITLEPGIVNEHGCFDVEENILVTEDGYEILSSASRNLHHIR